MTVARSSYAVARPNITPLGGSEQVEPGEWDRLARRGFHLRPWFRAAERSGWIPRHVAVRGASGLLSIVPAYLAGHGALHDLHDRWLGPLRQFALYAGFTIRPVLSVQSPLALVSEPLGDVARLSDAVLHRIFESLEQAAEWDGAKAVVWPFVDAARGSLLEVARERGYAVVYAGATARLPIRWESFEEYVASRSKNVRRTIRADLATIRSSGVRTDFLSDFRGEAAAMDRLYREAFRLRNGREAPVARNLFEQLALEPSPGMKAHLTWEGGRLVGTSLNLMTSEVLEGTLGAFMPEHRAGAVYYNDLCYEPIRLATRERVAALDLGATALYAKVLRGAVLRRRMTLIRGTTRSRHRLLSALGHLVARRTEYKERRALGPLWGRRCFSDGEAPA